MDNYMKKLNRQRQARLASQSMKKSKSTTRNIIKNENQAKELIISDLCQMMNGFQEKNISDGFACELVLYLVGHHILSKGDVESFNHSINQLIEHNQDLFKFKDASDDDDDETIH